MAGWLRELRRNLGSGAEGDQDPLVIHVVGTKSDIVAVDPSRRRVPFERTIAYVAEQLYPSRASTPPPTAGMGFGSGVFGSAGAGSASGGSASATSQGLLQSPDSKRSSAFWSQEIGWDCCHEISAKDGEGIDEVFRVITRKLVEQRNRRDVDPAVSAVGMPIGEGSAGSFTPGTADGAGGLSNADKRRSWLGLATATPTVGDGEEVEVLEAVRKKGRCC